MVAVKVPRYYRGSGTICVTWKKKNAWILLLLRSTLQFANYFKKQHFLKVGIIFTYQSVISYL